MAVYHNRLWKLSSYTAIGIWLVSSFMAQPTLASVIYHATVLPALIALTIWLAHREGYQDITEQAHDHHVGEEQHVS